ncbi:MAG TPA: hypothetical protein VJA94_02615 [Candidatus Angelobacter sp.]
MHSQKASLVAPIGLIVLLLGGCGGKTMCKINSINVFPAAATANHNALPPGNMQQFAAFIASEPSGCAFMQSNLTNATWSVSDTTNISIGNAPGTNGMATCNGATAGAATVTATVPAGDGTNVSNTASLTCN